jgi:opacity protein-like surface antigen
MNKKLLLSLALCAGLSSVAVADNYNNAVPAAYHEVPPTVSYPYIGGAFGLTKVKDDYYEYYSGRSEHLEIDYSALMFQGGYQYNPYVAMEFRYWFALGNGDYSIDSGYEPLPGSYNDFSAWGMYLKPMYPVTLDFSVYGLLGFSGVYVSEEAGFDLLYESSFSWGLGAVYDVTANIALFVDYVNLYNGTLDFYEYSQQDTVDTVNFGLTYKF